MAHGVPVSVPGEDDLSSVALVASTWPDGARSRRCPVAVVPAGDIAAGFSTPGHRGRNLNAGDAPAARATTMRIDVHGHRSTAEANRHGWMSASSADPLDRKGPTSPVSPPFLHIHPITASVTTVKPHGCHRNEGNT
jgi:hypothetical protein